MPFILTNAPAVFQRFIQQVNSGHNPAQDPEFIAAYIIFSATLEEHVSHLKIVLKQIIQTGLKLSKYQREVEYLNNP